MCGALDCRQFLSMNKLAQEFQEQRIRVVANELPSVTHVIVNGGKLLLFSSFFVCYSFSLCSRNRLFYYRIRRCAFSDDYEQYFV